MMPKVCCEAETLSVIQYEPKPVPCIWLIPHKIWFW